VLDILLFAIIGLVLGVIAGLIPGVHPNMIVLLVPALLSLNINPLNLIVMITALGVTNAIVDFIPSIFLGAPEGGTEFSVLPGHRMLLHGFGYEAVKLTVIGGVGSVFVILLLLPFMVFFVPPLFVFAKPYIYLLLLFIVLLMVLTESGKKKIYASLLFLVSGLIGIYTNRLPIDSSMILFPMLSGFFGLSMLILQLHSGTKIAKQHFGKIIIPNRLRNRSILFGSLGGILSGFLPGVGSSEIATISTVDKNDKSFLVTLGALTTANIIFSILTLWLIGRARSGVAVAINQISEIGINEILIILSVCVLSVGIGAIITLKLAKFFARKIERIDYNTASKLVIFLIIFLVFLFTGPFGLLVLATTASLGIIANLLGVKRGNLMGVLILPTMLFYAAL
jgi:putative membrane protein